MYFLPYVNLLLAQLALETLVVVMDGSVVGRGCLALMLHVVYKGRALPLAWRVRHGPKGHCPEALHIAMVELMSTLIPEGAKVVFLGDGEFDGTALQDTLNEIGWSYVCRTAMSTTATWEGEPFRLDALGACLQPGRNCSYKRLLPERRMVPSWYCVVGPRGIKSLCIWLAIWRQQRRRVAGIKSDSASRLFSQTRKVAVSIFISRI